MTTYMLRTTVQQWLNVSRLKQRRAAPKLRHAVLRLKPSKPNMRQRLHA